MPTASASPAKATRGRVTIAANTAAVAAAVEAAGPATLFQVVWPPLHISVRHAAIGSDWPDHAGEGVALPGRPSGNGWLIERIREHRAEDAGVVVTLTAHLVRHIAENGTAVKALAAAVQPVADETGAHIILTDPGTPQRVALPTVGPTPAGAAVIGAPGYAIGEARELTPFQASAMADVIVTLGRRAVSIMCTQDRLVARRHGGGTPDLQHLLYRADQPAAAWLAQVIGSFEPDLLVVEAQAAERGELDLDAIAAARRVAVAVLPAPATAGRTPQTMLEARS